jgi:hypothetical protein
MSCIEQYYRTQAAGDASAPEDTLPPLPDYSSINPLFFNNHEFPLGQGVLTSQTTKKCVIEVVPRILALWKENHTDQTFENLIAVIGELPPLGLGLDVEHPLERYPYDNSIAVTFTWGKEVPGVEIENVPCLDHGITIIFRGLDIKARGFKLSTDCHCSDAIKTKEKTILGVLHDSINAILTRKEVILTPHTIPERIGLPKRKSE